MTGRSRFLLLVLFGLSFSTGLNSTIVVVREALGFGYETFLFKTEDRFGDSIKSGLSYKKLLREMPDIDAVISRLEPIYQRFYRENPYGGIEAFPGLTHFHNPPFSTVFYLGVAYSIGFGVTPRSILVAVFLGCLVLTAFSAWWVSRTKEAPLALVGMVLASYPLLFTVTRGNYSAFACAIGVIGFLSALHLRRKLDAVSLILFAVAVNARPNALVLLMALPMYLGWRTAMRDGLKIIGLSGLIFVTALTAAHRIYPDYSLTTFLQGLTSYHRLYVEGWLDHSFNSSVYGVLKILGPALSLAPATITRMFIVLAAFMVLAVAGTVFSPRGNERYFPFLLSAVYVLVNPVVGDYHLLALIAPLFLIYVSFDEWKEDRSGLEIVAISTVLVLSPKSCIFIYGISPQVFFNPLLLMATSAILLVRVYRSPSAPGGICSIGDLPSTPVGEREPGMSEVADADACQKDNRPGGLRSDSPKLDKRGEEDQA